MDPTHPADRGNTLVLTCEHATNRVPSRYAALFAGADDVLASHRGWDPGALEAAQALGAELRRPVLAFPFTRLLVEANRERHSAHLWSAYTIDLPDEDKERILSRWWLPHRAEAGAMMRQAIAHRRRAVHVAVHSFTGVLDGKVRNADIGLLYDPSRSGERTFCDRWRQLLAIHAPDLRVRRNYPYRGIADGLPTSLRKQLRDEDYVGIELELNQATLADPERQGRMFAALAGTLREMLG
ncbi:MAG TPA: N-formylglutamate amidohydrolase [Candidatus Krumholzibacteria bacterium]|nr:N-formylglutamate amidohydrolase [Candidatus Krumholzibacteria bacterium]